MSQATVLADMQVIEVTSEATIGDYIYRVTDFRDGSAMMKRVPIERPLWTHGIMCEVYDPTMQMFRPILLVQQQRVPKDRVDAILASEGG